MHQGMPMKGLVIVVNYNQEHEIRAFLEQLSGHQPVADTLIVDDGSRDASPAIAERLGYRVLRHDVNRGVGAAIRTGIHEARTTGYDYVIINSSNGKMQPEDLGVIRGPIERGEAKYTTGSRFLAGGSSPGLPWFRRLAIPVFSGAFALVGTGALVTHDVPAFHLVHGLPAKPRQRICACGSTQSPLNWPLRGVLDCCRERLLPDALGVALSEEQRCSRRAA